MSLFLGIDTSNYKTSAALVRDDGTIIADRRRFLAVEKGNRGLRQQEALFQHVNALPDLLEEVFKAADGERPLCVSVSERPRPVEGSYMPVFNAGVSAGRSIAAALGCPCYMFSHQEMHIEAARHGTAAENWDRFTAFHFSGGTTEALIVSDGIEIIGGSRDIAFGQVLDRAGVALGLDFPAGAELDRIALDTPGDPDKSLLPRIKVSDCSLNLSGIDTACRRALEKAESRSERDMLIKLLFIRIAESMKALIKDACSCSGTSSVLLAGGVASSGFIRSRFREDPPEDIDIVFADPDLSSDNAVGTALLGMKRYGA